MKQRPLSIFAISLIAGILAAQANSYLLIVLTISCAAFCLIAFFRSITEVRYIAIIALVFYSIGAFQFIYIDNLNTNKFKYFTGKQVTIKGVIDSEPDIRQSKIVYVVKTIDITCSGATKKVQGKVSFTTANDENCLFEYGREITIKGLLNTAKGQRNPGGFDYRRYLAKSGISATIFALQRNIELGDKIKGNIAVKAGAFLRQKIVDVINKSLPAQQAGLLNGMLIGCREGLSKEVQQAFSDAGLTHIMAVSGANIAFLVFPLVFIFKKLHIGNRLANILIIGILILFAFITGFSPSVARAVIMAVTVLLGQIIYRDTEIITSISLSAILLLIYNPYNLFDIGFQLSYIATLSLILFYNTINSMISVNPNFKFITETAAVTLAAQVGVLPISTFYFNKISLISIVSNVVVVPVLEFITILGSLMAILGQISLILSQLIGYVNCTLLTFVLYVTKISASLPFATIRIITPSILIVFIYYIVILFVFWYKPKNDIKIKPVYYIAVAVGIATIMLVSILIPKDLEIVFIDVGEGDSTFIRTSSGKTVLIDGGGHSMSGGDNGSNGDSQSSDGTNIGDSIVIPFLLDYGVAKLDMVVATHGHADHIEGLIPVLRELKVDNLIIPDSISKKEFKELLDVSEQKKTKVSVCEKGYSIKIDGNTYFDVLNPKNGMDIEKLSLNNSSLVLKLHYGDIKMLFTGDAEEPVENMLLDDGDDIASDLLKVGHHGSTTSTKPAFLDAVNPKVAVICVGKNNFGHPSPTTLKSLRSRNIQIFRTDECGAIIVHSNGKRLKIKTTVTEKQ